MLEWRSPMNQEEQIIIDVEKHLDGDLEPFPKYGDLFTLEEFINLCKTGAFIDYDGAGYYATKSRMSRSSHAIPSEICDGKIDNSWSHVMWFNR